MWAVVCIDTYNYTNLSIKLFDDFDMATRFIRNDVEKFYREMSEYYDNISIEANYSAGHAEMIINGKFEYIWNTDFVGDVCKNCED